MVYTITAKGQTSGIAPQGIHLSISETMVWNTIRDQDYYWTVELDGGGETTFGKGYKQAYACLEPGTYTFRAYAVNSLTNDAVDMGSTSFTLTDPDTAYPDSRTLYVSTSGTFPVGATNTVTTTDPMHSDVYDALTSGNAWRIRYRGGETFSIAGANAFSLGDVADCLLDSYDTSGTLDSRGIPSDAPVVNADARNDGEACFTFAGQGVRMRGLKFTETASGGTSGGVTLDHTSGTSADFLIAQCEFENLGNCLIVTATSNTWNGVMMAQCLMDSPKSVGSYMHGTNVALLDTTMADATSDHFFRCELYRDLVLRGNDFRRGASGQHAVKIHSQGTAAADISERCWISENHFGWNVHIGPQNGGVNETCNDAWVCYNRAGPYWIYLWGVVNADLANNNCIADSRLDSAPIFTVERRGIEQDPSNVRVFHNTFLDTFSASDVQFLARANQVNNIDLANNIMWANGSAPVWSYAGNITQSNNYGSPNGDSDPLFVSTTPGAENLALQATSPARGTCNSGARLAVDYVGGYRPTTNWDPGTHEESPVAGPVFGGGGGGGATAVGSGLGPMAAPGSLLVR